MVPRWLVNEVIDHDRCLVTPVWCRHRHVLTPRPVQYQLYPGDKNDVRGRVRTGLVVTLADEGLLVDVTWEVLLSSAVEIVLILVNDSAGNRSHHSSSGRWLGLQCWLVPKVSGLWFRWTTLYWVRLQEEGYPLLYCGLQQLIAVVVLVVIVKQIWLIVDFIIRDGFHFFETEKTVQHYRYAL
jgi:hypothetical protein